MGNKVHDRMDRSTPTGLLLLASTSKNKKVEEVITSSFGQQVSKIPHFGETIAIDDESLQLSRGG